MFRYSLILFIICCGYCKLNAQLVVKHWSNGNLMERGKLKNGIRVGKWCTWYENGQLKSISKYKFNKDGWPDGVSTGFYLNGKIKYKLRYFHSDHSEVRMEYWESGQLKSKAHSTILDLPNHIATMADTTYYSTGQIYSTTYFNMKVGIWSYRKLDVAGNLIYKVDLALGDQVKRSYVKYEYIETFFPLDSAFDPGLEVLNNIRLFQPWLVLNGMSFEYNAVGDTVCEIGFYKNAITYKWLNVYSNDAIAYSSCVIGNDTTYVYPVPMGAPVEHRHKDLYLGLSENSVADNFCLPGELPANFPDGHWVRCARKNYREHAFMWVDSSTRYHKSINRAILYEVEYKDNRKTGEAKLYSLSLPSTWKVVNGDTFPIGLDTSYDWYIPLFVGGSLKIKYSCDAGAKNGEYIVYDGDSIFEIANYINGKASGAMRFYSVTGMVWKSYEYLEGRKTGLFQEYYPDGNVMEQKIYKNDTCYSRKYWDENGSLILDETYEYFNGQIAVRSVYEKSYLVYKLYYRKDKYPNYPWKQEFYRNSKPYKVKFLDDNSN